MLAVILVCATLASPFAVFGAIVGLMLEKNYSTTNKIVFTVSVPVFLVSVFTLLTWF